MSPSAEKMLASLTLKLFLNPVLGDTGVLISEVMHFVLQMSTHIWPYFAAFKTCNMYLFG